MAAHQPRAQLRDVAAPGTFAEHHRRPVQLSSSAAKPLPPAPSPGSGPSARGSDTGNSDDGRISGELDSGTEREGAGHRTGTPPGSTSIIVAGKVYHVVDNPRSPGLPPELSQLHMAEDMAPEDLEPENNLPVSTRSGRRKTRPKAKGRSLAAPPAISSPVPFPQAETSSAPGNALVEQTFERQQELHYPRAPSPQGQENAMFIERPRSRSPPTDRKPSLLDRLRSRPSRHQAPIIFPAGDSFAHSDVEQQQLDDQVLAAPEDEFSRGRPRKPSFTEGLTRSLSGAYRSVRSGVGRRLSLRRTESMARRSNGKITKAESEIEARGDALDAIAERMKRNCTRAQSGFNSGFGHGSQETVHKDGERKVTPDDLPPQWHVALKRDLDELLLGFAGR